MNKQVTVTFEFDVETQTVSKLKCFVDGVESKKKTTRSAPSKSKDEVVLEDKPVITLEPTKLVFNNRCIADMGIQWQDRIIIKYEKVKDQKKPFPIIGKDESFDEVGSGNKISKTNTMAYRGKANGILESYGTEFTIEPYENEGIYKLVPISGGGGAPTYEEVEEKAEELDVTIFTDEETEEEFEIEELPFKF